MNKTIIKSGLVIAALAGLTLLPGCAGKVDGRTACANSVDAAWNALNIAETEGFAGSVSYSKAASLLTAAKFQQTIERFDSCVDKAQRASNYAVAAQRGE
ncbi:hypothetical protein [Umboniibacter marinipuniceus]|uniref:Lipoprotein n=1 Tax=Umboniibacter marinipuniceus TaxID=569599 RepID=A0A3M0AJ12_9GAMM|nr:hypothetical protein [Umboniibacter marinipuniceus]RMA82545.1 hypothetical protein DFR27_0495 [Umboniibacter marinipuniceus]